MQSPSDSVLCVHATYHPEWPRALFPERFFFFFFRYDGYGFEIIEQRKTGRSTRYATEQSVINAKRRIARALSQPRAFSTNEKRVRAKTRIHTHLHTHPYVHTFTYAHEYTLIYGIQNECTSSHFKWRSNETRDWRFDLSSDRVNLPSLGVGRCHQNKLI